ncbi:MAG: tripartite tricarboxylate transporter substrate-binding protein [Pigmentiphaga sp.]|uniref:Bug family tripartite tricarboxylate transporter substrate binding protein n=1 Tax=Pigmentiphaga sp. TaxID=1977564 RepID=UPI0029BD375D|nr:tripartite tricarboxylate transporter substrate-binding protein [Pigmentiphaga sp.]MDX3907163.1 tripartite tricarboxylate transporter substrate-binding protein [Pigmentiphaga sp.]
MHRMIRRLILGSASCVTAMGVWAATPDYPNKPIKLIVAFPTGGPADVTARIISQRVSEHLGQAVVIENRGGAGGNIGAQAVAKADPDGYTYLVTTTSFAVNPALFGKEAGYDAVKDFVPVSIIATQPNAIAVHKSLGIQTLAQLRERAGKGKLSFASPGAGTTPHLTGENLFKIKWKADLTHVPYRGAGPAAAALAAGEPAVGSLAVAGILPFVKSGRVVPLAVSSKERIPTLPDVPTLAELGYPDILDYTWTAVLAPAGTPKTRIERFGRAIDQSLQDPEVKNSLAVQALIPVGGTPDEFGTYLKGELKRWAAIVRETGAKLEQ